MLPRLMVISDAGFSEAELLERLTPVLTLGPEVAVQLRLPGASARTLFELGRRLLERCRPHANPLFVNGRLDVALALEAHLHLPVDAPRPREVRALLGSRWISAAVHSAAEAREIHDADLALISPVFSPGSKPEDTRMPLGPDGLERLARVVPCPVLALGGVGPDNVQALRGVHGAAVIGAVLRASDPLSAARRILEALKDEALKNAARPGER